jgi:restriction system protein
MARRGQKRLIAPKAIFGLLAILAAIGLAQRFLEHLPRGSGDAIRPIVLAIVAGVLAYPVVRFLRRANARHALLQKTGAMVEQQMESLLRRRSQLVRPDAYGKPRLDKWEKEIDYFIDHHIQPSLRPSEQDALDLIYDEVAGVIRDRVEAAIQSQPVFHTFSDDMTAAEFEIFCAEELRRSGWDAGVTMQGRDQGVDVIGEKDGRRVVLQCKLYARPVGNKSVQEAAAARAHEQADFGIVVSNNRYTAAAEELAATNGVLLLHYRDLQKLDDILSGHRSAGVVQLRGIARARA